MERLIPGKEAQDYLYLGKDKLAADIGVGIMREGKQVVKNLLLVERSGLKFKRNLNLCPVKMESCQS